MYGTYASYTYILLCKCVITLITSIDFVLTSFSTYYIDKSVSLSSPIETLIHVFMLRKAEIDRSHLTELISNLNAT